MAIDRQTQELNTNESFESLEFWEQIRLLSISNFEQIHKNINTKLDDIEKLIDKRIKELETNIIEKLDNINNLLSISNDLKSKFDNELINLNNVYKVLEKYNGTKIVINEPKYDDLINSITKNLANIVEDTVNQHNKIMSLKENIVNNLVVSKMNNIENLTQKINDDTKKIENTYNNFLGLLRKGENSIFESEIIIGKLLYSLRFLDRLPNDIRDKLLQFSEKDFKDIREYIKTLTLNNNEDDRTLLDVALESKK